MIHRYTQTGTSGTQAGLIFDAAAKVWVAAAAGARAAADSECSHKLSAEGPPPDAAGARARAEGDWGGAGEGGQERRRVTMAQLKAVLQVNALSFLHGIAEGIYSARRMRWRPHRQIWARAAPDAGAGDAGCDNSEAEAAALMVGVDREALASATGAVWGRDGGGEGEGEEILGLHVGAGGREGGGPRWRDVALADHGQALRVFWGVGAAADRIEKLELWDEEVVMQLVGWEWDPRRLEVCREDASDEGGDEGIIW